MPWQLGEQRVFIRDHLGPAFQKAGLQTKVILFDHNCDRADYPLALLNDPALAKYVAVTIDGDKVTRNLAYYTVAHASKFVRPGSVRLGSTYRGDKSVNLTEDEEKPGVARATVVEDTQVLPNVAFRTPDDKIILIVANDSFANGSFRIHYHGQIASVRLNPGAVGTYIWPTQ